MKTIISAIAIAGIFTFTSCSHTNTQQTASQHTIDSLNTELAKKKVIDSMNDVARLQSFPVPAATTTPVQPVAAAPAVATSTHRSTTTSRSHATSRSSAPATVYQEPAPARKKGWSAKAKGAVIGAGTGAVAGAVINKRNRGVGAIIGGVLGAATGTGVGAIIDKKKGR